MCSESMQLLIWVVTFPALGMAQLKPVEHFRGDLIFSIGACLVFLPSMMFFFESGSLYRFPASTCCLHCVSIECCSRRSVIDTPTDALSRRVLLGIISAQETRRECLLSATAYT